MAASNLTNAIDYTSPEGNFTFDSDFVEFTGSGVRLKDITPSDSTFFDNFDDASEANWADNESNLARTLNNSAAITSGKLDLTGGTNKNATYSGAGLVDGGVQVGAVRFLYTPNYTGAPASNVTLFTLQESASVTNNRIQIQHISSGKINLAMVSSSGTTIYSAQTSAKFWNVVSGQTYEIEFNWNLDAGQSRLFIDGVQFDASAIATSGTRSNSSQFLRLGADSSVSDHEIDNFIVFSTVQHTADYTPGAAISSTRYTTTAQKVDTNSGVLADAYESLAETDTTTPSNTTIQHNPIFNDAAKYWDGSSWLNSDNTFVQSNDVATNNTNASSLDISLGGTLKHRLWLESSDGKNTPEAVTVTQGYNFFQSNTSVPATCTVYGFILKPNTEPIEGVTVTVSLKRQDGQYREAGDDMIDGTLTTTTDANGRYEFNLIRSSEFEAGGNYLATFVKSSDSINTTSLDPSKGRSIEFTVPDETDTNIGTIIASVA